MKNQSIYIIGSLAFLFLLNACNSLDKLARNDQEYDDLYYSTKDRPVFVASTSRTPSRTNTNSTQIENPSNPGLDIPFDNENINSDYVAPQNPTYSTNSYFDPNYEQNLNTGNYYPNSNIAFQNDPYFYDPFYRANTWCPTTFNRGFNVQVGFGNTWGRRFGNPFYDPFFQPWSYGYGINQGFYSGYWNNPYAWNSPYFYNQPVAVYYPTSGAIYNGVNTSQEVVQRTRYYGPRTNNGANKIISNASRRRVNRTSTVRTTTSQVGLEDNTIQQNTGTRTSRSQRYPSRTRNSYNQTSNSSNLSTTPNTNTRSRVTSPTKTRTTPRVSPTRTRSRTVSPSRSTTTSPSRTNRSRVTPSRTSPNINRTRSSTPSRRVTPSRSPSRTSPSRSSGGSRSRSSTPVKRSPRR